VRIRPAPTTYWDSVSKKEKKIKIKKDHCSVTGSPPWVHKTKCSGLWESYSGPMASLNEILMSTSG
jgi:hypothetical protein